jgi:guanine deaminase
MYRGAIYQPLSQKAYAFWPDGLLMVDAAGKIIDCGPWEAKAAQYGVSEQTDLVRLTPTQLIIPGLMDLHVHLPQFRATGCQSGSLLDWLKRYIFTEEAHFASVDYARAVAEWFCYELLKNGTTTAATFLTVHVEATHLAFEVAERMGNRMIMGLNLMDEGAPDYLTRPAEKLLAETELLCRTWHGRDNGRLLYAWMPRFALACSETLMAGIGRLRERYPDVYCHTHLSEQPDEVAAVLAQFPQAKHYTGVYDQYGLVGPRSLFAHGIHLSDEEMRLIHQRHSCLVHCPSSNFFLKSGRFKLESVLQHDLLWGLGSDVGAGPELSMFKVMRDAQFMQPDWVVPAQTLFYAATLGAAKGLMLDDRLGNLLPGKEADFVVLNRANKSSLPEDALQSEADWDRWISRLIYLGDDRLVDATYVRGRKVYEAGAQPTVCLPGSGSDVSLLSRV